MHEPWEASSFYLEHHYMFIIIFFNWYLSFIWYLVVSNWFIRFLSIGIFLCPIGGFVFHLVSSLVQLVYSFVQLVLWFIWLLASYVEASSPCYLIAIFDPQYSLISSKYSSLDTCIWFHSYYEKCTPYGGTLSILAF